MSKEYVVIPKEDYVDTCNAIREKTNSTALLKSNEMAQAVRDIQGNDADYSPYINDIDFRGVSFPEAYELSLNLKKATSFSFVDTNGIRKITIKGNEKKNIMHLQHCFLRCTSLEEVDFSEYNLIVSSMREAFQGSSKLRCIYGYFDLTNCYDTFNAFIWITTLEEIRFVKETIYVDISFAQSERLSAESVDSIIEGLADLTGRTAQTLTVHKNVEARITNEQKNVIKNKNWNLAVV